MIALQGRGGNTPGSFSCRRQTHPDRAGDAVRGSARPDSHARAPRRPGASHCADRPPVHGHCDARSRAPPPENRPPAARRWPAPATVGRCNTKPSTPVASSASRKPASLRRIRSAQVRGSITADASRAAPMKVCQAAPDAARKTAITASKSFSRAGRTHIGPRAMRQPDASTSSVSSSQIGSRGTVASSAARRRQAPGSPPHPRARYKASRSGTADPARESPSEGDVEFQPRRATRFIHLLGLYEAGHHRARA